MIELGAVMLVEGGYLHSMKRLLETASAEADAPRPKKGSLLARWRGRTPFSVLTPLKRLGFILLGGSFRG